MVVCYSAHSFELLRHPNVGVAVVATVRVARERDLLYSLAAGAGTAGQNLAVCKCSLTSRTHLSPRPDLGRRTKRVLVAGSVCKREKARERREVGHFWAFFCMYALKKLCLNRKKCACIAEDMEKKIDRMQEEVVCLTSMLA